MGYALPAAIGASFACANKRRIFAIVGDGGFHISLQSLMLVSQYNLPIKIIVMNNHSLGMITQFQDLYFERRKCATTKEGGYLVPNIRSLAEAYRLPHFMLDPKTINESAYLDTLFNNQDNCIIEVKLDAPTTVIPKLEINTPIEDTSPKLDRDELKRNMLIKLFDKKEAK